MDIREGFSEEVSLEGPVEAEKELTRQWGRRLSWGGREDEDRHSRPACTGRTESGWRDPESMMCLLQGLEPSCKTL